jgi:hypothetical protein
VRFRVVVVIQSYLVAELAGVCFSRDPLNPWDRNGQVEWVQGAGEGLVQGTVPAKKRRRFEGADPETAQLWDGLWKRADSAEKLVGGPADLEWVWDGAQLWFVQARPIATPEARLVARAPGRRWSRAQTMERFPEAITPMGWSVLRGAFTGNLTSLSRRFGVVAKSPEDVAISLRGTVYSDPQFFSFPGGVRIRWAKYLNPLSRAPWAVLGTFFRCLGRSLGGTRQNLSRALLKLDLADALVGAQARQIEAGWDRHRDHSLERLRSFDPLGPAHRLLDRMAALEEIGREFMEPDLAVYLVKETYHKALLGVWRALGLADHDFSDLFRAFTGNRTLEMNQDLDACIQSLRQDPGCPRFIELLEGAHSLAQGLLAAAGLSPDAQAKWNHFITRRRVGWRILRA